MMAEHTPHFANLCAMLNGMRKKTQGVFFSFSLANFKTTKTTTTTKASHGKIFLKIEKCMAGPH